MVIAIGHISTLTALAIMQHSWRSGCPDFDLDNPDFERFPNAHDLPHEDCLLEAGQMLFVPNRCGLKEALTALILSHLPKRRSTWMPPTLSGSPMHVTCRTWTVCWRQARCCSSPRAGGTMLGPSARASQCPSGGGRAQHGRNYIWNGLHCCCACKKQRCSMAPYFCKTSHRSTCLT